MPSSAGSSSTSRRGWSPRVAVTVAYPLLFVRAARAGCPRSPWSRCSCTCSSSGSLQRAFGLAGVAVGLGVTTALVAARGAASRCGAVRPVARGVALAALVCGGLAVAAFGLPRLVVGPVPAAVVGLVAYVVVLARLAAAGLRHAWAYVRALQ